MKKFERIERGEVHLAILLLCMATGLIVEKYVDFHRFEWYVTVFSICPYIATLIIALVSTAIEDPIIIYPKTLREKTSPQQPASLEEAKETPAEMKIAQLEPLSPTKLISEIIDATIGLLLMLAIFLFISMCCIYVPLTSLIIIGYFTFSVPYDKPYVMRWQPHIFSQTTA